MVILVIHDMLGMNNEFSPRFTSLIKWWYDKAISQYVDVVSSDFPNDKEQY
jgi:3-methyl-2-oxobutanoate hydroxymethyltransferase